MEPVEEFARLKSQIMALREQAAILQADFLRPGPRLSGNRNAVVVRRKTRRVFHKDLLPTSIFGDPRY